MMKPEDLAWYRKQSINILPVKYGGKESSVSWMKYKTDKISAEDVKYFFYDKSSNLGAMTGAVSENLIIIDFDRAELLEKFFTENERKKMVIIQSGRKEIGYHAYFKTVEPLYSTFSFHHPDQPNAITVKGSGYAVAPPSIHPSGNRYKFIQQPDEIPVLTGNVKEELKRRALACGLTSESVGGLDIVDILKGASRGKQDDSIMYLSYYLRRQGATFEEAYSIIQLWSKLCNPIIPDMELREKLKTHYDRSEPYSFYYVTNPAKFKITSELKLENNMKAEAEVVQTLITESESGHQSINIDALCEYLDAEYKFKGPNDIDEVLIYKDGIYITDTGELDTTLERFFGGLAHMKFKAEIRRHMRDRNRIDREEMNKDVEKIVVENGILNIKTFELEPFSSDLVYTTKIPVNFDPNANAYEFETTIAQILDKGDIPIMQELFGYCLVMSYEVAKSFWFLGEGGNGKGTIIHVLESLLGLKNVSRLSLSQFSAHANFDIVELYGKLANVSQEPGIRETMETNVLKAVTGDDYLQGKIKYKQGHKTFKNTAKLIITANELPQIEDESYGFWSRVVAIPFPNTFRDVEGVDIIGLGNKLSTPEILSGILNWALVGLHRLRENNYRFTSSLTRQGKELEMMMQTNPVKAFAKYWLKLDPKGSIPIDAVSDAFNLFAHLNGIQPKAKNAVSQALQRDKRLGSKQTRNGYSRVRILQGCTFTKDLTAVYGHYRNEPVRENGFGSVSDPETEIKIKTCTLVDYFFNYPEPYEEVEVLRDGKRLIFNCEELIPLYDKQIKDGFEKPESRKPAEVPKVSTSKQPELQLKHLSSPDKASCERCGKSAFLEFELTDEDGTQLLICYECAYEIKSQIGEELPKIFNTSLEERRQMLKDEEKGGKKL